MAFLEHFAIETDALLSYDGACAAIGALRRAQTSLASTESPLLLGLAGLLFSVGQQRLKLKS